TFEYKKHRIEFEYEVPANKVGSVEISPSLIKFGQAKPGLLQTQQITIVPHNIPVTFRSAKLHLGEPFSLSDTSLFPIVLKPEEKLNVKVNFTPADAGIYNDGLKISIAECPDISTNLLAGGEEQIKLFFPLGGEVFTVGEDTAILWEGVKRSQPVAISYKLHKKDGWKPVTTSQNLRYDWNLPRDTSSQVQVKLTPIKSAEENMEISAVTQIEKTPITSLFYSPDGKKLVTTDENSFVKTWDSETGKLISYLGGYDVEKAMIGPDTTS
ncbi:MAG: hypothetical protein HC905_28995, partial [Bacteroidales bacterium]|nr:hypothetical protein [Bacteroidales bacterium]